MKNRTDKEILEYLLSKLEDGRGLYMCGILSTINVPCSFLHSCGLAKLWEEEGGRVKYAWGLDMPGSESYPQYENRVTKTKIRLIKKLIAEKYT